MIVKLLLFTYQLVHLLELDVGRPVQLRAADADPLAEELPPGRLRFLQILPERDFRELLVGRELLCVDLEQEGVDAL